MMATIHKPSCAHYGDSTALCDCGARPTPARTLTALPMVVQRSLIALESIRRVLEDYDSTHSDLFDPFDSAMNQIDALFEDGCGPYGATDCFNADPALRGKIETLLYSATPAKGVVS